MLTTLDELSHLLQIHHIDAEDLEELEIESTSTSAFALAIDPAQELAVWQLFRNLVPRTQCYPVLIEDWGSTRDFFSSYWYEQERAADFIPAITPHAILAAVPQADLDMYLRDQESIRGEQWDDTIDRECTRTKERFGTCPPREMILALVNQGVLQSAVDFERWLFGWERQTFGDVLALASEDISYLDWFDATSDPSTLILLPVIHGWNTLAYLHWYGALTSGTPVAIQFLKKWHRDYGAELVCHYGTMLQLVAGQVPATPEAAFQLAWEQVALAECTTLLAGVSIRDHARALLTTRRWFLHERP